MHRFIQRTNSNHATCDDDDGDGEEEGRADACVRSLHERPRRPGCTWESQVHQVYPKTHQLLLAGLHVPQVTGLETRGIGPGCQEPRRTTGHLRRGQPPTTSSPGLL